jgi:hypothetical protein
VAPGPSWCIVLSSSRAATDATKSVATTVVVALTGRRRSAGGSRCPAESWRSRCFGTMWGRRLGGRRHNYCVHHLVLPRSAPRTLRHSLVGPRVAWTSIEWSIRRAESPERQPSKGKRRSDAPDARGVTRPSTRDLLWVPQVHLRTGVEATHPAKGLTHRVLRELPEQERATRCSRPSRLYRNNAE